MSPASSCAFGPRQVSFLGTDAGWSSSVARRAHNPEVAGSNPVPATRKTQYFNEKSLRYWVSFCPDKADSLCYSLPFSQTQARRRGEGGGGLSINVPLRVINQRPCGAYGYLRPPYVLREGVEAGDLYRLNSILYRLVPPKKAQAVRSFASYFNGKLTLYRLYRLKSKTFIYRKTRVTCNFLYFYTH